MRLMMNVNSLITWRECDAVRVLFKALRDFPVVPEAPSHASLVLEFRLGATMRQ